MLIVKEITKNLLEWLITYRLAICYSGKCKLKTFVNSSHNRYTVQSKRFYLGRNNGKYIKKPKNPEKRKKKLKKVTVKA